MKNPDDPMSLDDIETLLFEASRSSNHRQFVIAGSLSCVASAVRLPNTMMMSRDVDLYTKEDPERVFVEISKDLSEGSDFHKKNGFYADAISPNILALPLGWEARLAPMTLKGGVIAWFVNANDTACGKLIRGNENDIEWIKSGIEEKILNSDLIESRLKTCENVLENEIQKAELLFTKIVSIIKKHKTLKK